MKQLEISFHDKLILLPAPLELAKCVTSLQTSVAFQMLNCPIIEHERTLQIDDIIWYHHINNNFIGHIKNIDYDCGKSVQVRGDFYDIRKDHIIQCRPHGLGLSGNNIYGKIKLLWRSA